MYQAIHYDRRSHHVWVRDDEQGWLTFPYEPVYYQTDPQGPCFTLTGERVRPVKRFEKSRTDIWERDVDGPLRVLSDLYLHQNEIPKFQRLLFFDIETEIGGALTRQFIESAPMPVTSVAFYDATTRERKVFLHDRQGGMVRTERNGVEVVPFRTEAELLMAVVNYWEMVDPTIVTGWNSDKFDIPYLYYRLRGKLGAKQANRLSPIGIVEKAYFETEDKPLREEPPKLLRIAGLNSLDYMRLFQKFIQKAERTYALGYIGEKYVKLGKIHYKGNLNRLYAEDIDKFVDYNIRDVDILVKLNEKFQFIDLTVMISHIAHTGYENIYFSSLVLDGVIYTVLKRRGIVSPNKPVTNDPSLRIPIDEDDDEVKFPGAFVKPPQIGLHDWLTDEDLAALYPSLMRTLNTGSETIIGRVFDPLLGDEESLFCDRMSLAFIRQLDEVIFVNRQGQQSRLNGERLAERIMARGYAVSGNGIIFDQSKKSILSEVLEEWGKDRKKFKNLMLDAAKADDREKEKFYDNYQQVFKRFANSIYGVMALPSFRYTDARKWISTAVTLSGQVTIKSSINQINEALNAEIGTTDEDYVVASDTDSMFIKCWPLVQKRLPGVAIDDKAQIIPVIREVAGELKDRVNRFYDHIAADHFNARKHFLEIKPEYVIQKAYWSDKKKYACYLVEKEGNPVEAGKEFDFKGLDLMKANFPPKYKEFMEGVLKGILTGSTPQDVDRMVLVFREFTRSCAIHETCTPTRSNGIAKYTAAKPRPSQIFSTIGLHCPVQVKAAIFYNDLLRFKGLDKQFSCFQDGDSLYYSYLRRNPYNLPVLAFNGFDDPPFITELIEKFGDRKKNFESILMNKIQKVYDTLSWGKVVTEPYASSFLS